MDITSIGIEESRFCNFHHQSPNIILTQTNEKAVNIDLISVEPFQVNMLWENRKPH